MRILIIEDFEPIAKAMQQALREQGHTVDWIIGVNCFQPFVGITDEKQPQPMDVSQYELVLCDGELFGPNQGVAIVKELSARHLACIAISSQPSMNDEMKDNGAAAGFMKTSAFAAIALTAVPMDQWQQADAACVRQIESFNDSLRNDRELRRKLDQLIMQHA